MTTPLTRERIEQYANDPLMCNINDEIRELARMALAAMDSEPVAVTDDELNAALQLHRLKVEGHSQLSDAFRAGFRYARRTSPQPAPVIPPEMTACQAYDLLMKKGGVMSPVDAAVFAWNACRAAMLQAGNSPAIPDTWIPVSDHLPEEGGRYWCYVEEQNSLGKSHYQWNCSWNGEIWGGAMMHGRVTHWMPLPAAPQEVK
ncbi:DUF551 domain-containing protein [Klebsiella aerogenes]|uniref:DUF551 domain-containing protein n=1 Tax=Klebsiella aerogenes TaxID=548 RepID=UPI0021B1EEA7|nr:DUF551 domain-containing protein [Klebsiella aerogenes]